VQAHDRHAAYFLALAEPAAAELAGPGQLAWLDRLETEHDNLWAAMSWLVDHGPLEQEVHLFLVTWRFWWLRGHAAEFVRLGDKIVANSQDLPPYQHAMALNGTAFILIANDDLAQAQTVLEQSLPLYRQAAETLAKILPATVLAILGRLAAIRRDYAAASKLLDESQAVLRELRHDDLTGYDRLQYLLTAAYVNDVLGQVRLSQGDHDAAARLFTDSLTLARRSLDSVPILISLYDLALARQAQGDLAAAEGHLKVGLALAAEAGDETTAAYYLEALAAIARQQGNAQRAVRLLAAAHSILEARGSGWLCTYVPRPSHDDAVLPALRSRMGDAAFEEAQAWGKSTGSRRALAYALE